MESLTLLVLGSLLAVDVHVLTPTHHIAVRAEHLDGRSHFHPDVWRGKQSARINLPQNDFCEVNPEIPKICLLLGLHWNQLIVNAINHPMRFFSLTVHRAPLSGVLQKRFFGAMKNVCIEKLNDLPPCLLGESPRWLVNTKSLVYIDILSKSVFIHNSVSGKTDSMVFDQAVGFALPSSEPSKFCVGLEDSIVYVDWDVKQIIGVTAAVPSSIYKSGMRFNDGECNPRGELFAGYMHSQWRDGHSGHLFYLSPVPSSIDCASENEQPKALVSVFSEEEPVHLPNGSVWLDNQTQFFIDSKHNVIYRLDYNIDSNTAGSTRLRLVGRTVVYSLSEAWREQGGMMDGMAIDDENLLYVAVTNAGCILRIDPASGQEVSHINLPCKKPTACCFGNLAAVEYVCPTV